MSFQSVILAGGFGERMRSSEALPKPLRPVGGRPVLGHLIDSLLDRRVSDVVICGGFGAEAIRQWLDDEHGRSESAVDGTWTYRAAGGQLLRLVSTGVGTPTGGRLKIVLPLLDETFLVTYADGLADIDLDSLHAVHLESGARVTVSATPLVASVGVLALDEARDLASAFVEKSALPGYWVNIGYQLVERSVIAEHCEAASEWECDVLALITKAGDLAVHRHRGQWVSMNSQEEHTRLEETWRSTGAFWRSCPA